MKEKYIRIFSYAIFGILTTLINLASYEVFLLLGYDYKFSTTIAFVISIVFAYITNKIWVFKSYVKGFKRIFKEFSRFLLARISTYFIDLIGLIFLVEYLNFNQSIGKIIMNVIIVILNYVLSKKVYLQNNSYE